MITSTVSTLFRLNLKTQNSHFHFSFFVYIPLYFFVRVRKWCYFYWMITRNVEQCDIICRLWRDEGFRLYQIGLYSGQLKARWGKNYRCPNHNTVLQSLMCNTRMIEKGWNLSKIITKRISQQWKAKLSKNSTRERDWEVSESNFLVCREMCHL